MLNAELLANEDPGFRNVLEYLKVSIDYVLDEVLGDVGVLDPMDDLSVFMGANDKMIEVVSEWE